MKVTSNIIVSLMDRKNCGFEQKKKVIGARGLKGAVSLQYKHATDAFNSGHDDTFKKPL
jgi:hypothetical protein